MKPLKKVTAIAVVLIGIFAFSKADKKTKDLTLNIDQLNVVDVLTKQQFECRPSSDFMFIVETDLLYKSRGANTVNAKVFILETETGKKSLLAKEDIQILKFDGAISIENNSNFVNKVLKNGDKLISNNKENAFNFDELIQYESIYNSYIKSTNKLLDLKRSI